MVLKMDWNDMLGERNGEGINWLFYVYGIIMILSFVEVNNNKLMRLVWCDIDVCCMGFVLIKYLVLCFMFTISTVMSLKYNQSFYSNT